MRELLIEPGRAERNYWRDILVRYQQTAIGFAGALLRPALTMLVFVGLRKAAKLFVDGFPATLFVFATVLSEAPDSLLGNA